MNPKSGKACSQIEPTAPNEAIDADLADPGEVAETKAREREMKEGKYGEVKSEPYKSEQEESEKEETETTWIEIELVNEADEPVTGEKYEIKLPDGKLAKGTTDGMGWARVSGFEPGGSCKVCFPDLDKDAWEFIESVGSKMDEGGS